MSHWQKCLIRKNQIERNLKSIHAHKSVSNIRFYCLNLWNQLQWLKNDWEKTNDLNSSNNSNNKLKEMITCFNDEKRKSRKNYTNEKAWITSIEKLIFLKNCSNFHLCNNICGLIVTSTSMDFFCRSITTNNVFKELIMGKVNKLTFLRELNKLLTLLIN